MLQWKLDATQTKIYDFFKSKKEKTVVINASRRLGKSFALIVVAMEQALQHPKSIIKFLQPEVKMIRTNIRPIIDEITVDCPPELMPEFRTQDNIYYFKNGSQIQLAGTDNGNYMKLRGGQCHLALIDEAGFCTDLKHIIDYILTPTTLLTRGKIILSSTTPPTPDHEFITYMENAEVKGTLIKKTIYDAVDDSKDSQNPRITKEIVDEIIASIDGGADSDSFRTEFLCEKIFNSTSSVVPEFTTEIQEDTIKTWRKPPFADNYVAMDIGFVDLTALLFAYYDFDNGVLVVEDELALEGRSVTAENVNRLVREKEEKLWTSPITGEFQKPYMRVSDNNLIFLNDLNITYNLQFIPTDKHNKDSYINKMRTMISARRIIINPKCINLITHLKNGSWDKTRKTFKRSGDNGHYDFLDSLAYLVRNIDENRNPYPKNFRYSKLGGNPDNIFYKKEYYENTKHSGDLNKLADSRNPKSSLTNFKSKSSTKKDEEMFSYFQKKDKK